MLGGLKGENCISHTKLNLSSLVPNLTASDGLPAARMRYQNGRDMRVIRIKRLVVSAKPLPRQTEIAFQQGFERPRPVAPEIKCESGRSLVRVRRGDPGCCCVMGLSVILNAGGDCSHPYCSTGPEIYCISTILHGKGARPRRTKCSVRNRGSFSKIQSCNLFCAKRRACRADRVDMLAGSRARRDFTRAVSGMVDSAVSNIPQLRRAGEMKWSARSSE
jgi:hypothetical protein